MEKSSIKISSDNSLPDILSNIRKGHWKIPRFQREFVWEKKKVIELFDSMYKGFPIGSFFLWIPPDEYVLHYKDIPELQIEQDDKKFYTYFILDGQQRLTSLYVTYRGLTIKNTDYSTICFDLDKERVNADPVNGERNIQVCSVLQENYHEVYNQLTDDRKRSFMRFRERFQKYPFPVVIIEDKNIEEACKIFERINQGGKRLEIFDLVVAVTWDKDFELRDKIKIFNNKLKGNFGEINEEVFSETLSLIVHKQCTRAFQLKLTPDDVKSKWDDVEDAIGKSIQFLRAHLKVRSYSYLPYRDILAIISYYFYECNKSNQEPNKEFLENWFWKVSFSNRYSGSSFTKIGEDRAYIFDKVLEGQSPVINYTVVIDLEKVKSLNMGRSTALRNALILIMIQQTPLSFKDNSPIDIEKDPVSEFNSSEKHHIFPRKFLKDQGVIEKKATDLLANFCLIDSNLNKEINGTSPKEYFQIYKDQNSSLGKALDSHLISTGQDSAIWENDYKKFIEQRSEILLRQIKKRIGDLTASVEEQMQSDPSRLIQKLEQRVRETIHVALYDEHGENWWDAEDVVPQDVREYAKVQIKKEKTTKPYIPDEEWNSPMRKLEQINVMDYLKIILNNWVVFEDLFVSKKKLEQHFEGFSTIRNQVQHNKTIDPTERKQGETSIEWLLKCIQEKDQESEAKQEIETPSYLLVNELYEQLKASILIVDPQIQEKDKSHYKAFSTHGFFNFCTFRFRKDYVLVQVIVRKGSLEDPRQLTAGYTVRESPGIGKYYFAFKNKGQIDDAMNLIKQAYNFSEELRKEKEDNISLRGSLNLEFWAGLLDKAKQKDDSFKNLHPSRYHWKGKGSGKQGLRFAFVIWDHEASVELYFDAGKNSKEINKRRYDQFFKHKGEIEKRFSQSLSWERLDSRRAARIAYRFSNKGLKDKLNWELLQSEMIEKMILLETSFSPYIDKMEE